MSHCLFPTVTALICMFRVPTKPDRTAPVWLQHLLVLACNYTSLYVAICVVVGVRVREGETQTQTQRERYTEMDGKRLQGHSIDGLMCGNVYLCICVEQVRERRIEIDVYRERGRAEGHV